MVIKLLFSRLKIKVRPKGLRSFAFFFQSLIPRPQSLIPNPSPLTPDPSPLTPRLSTTVVSALQIKLFMQNKANFQKVKLNVSKVLTKDYDQLDTWSIRKNEPKTNPNEPKTNPIKANILPKQSQFKPNQTQSPAGSSAARKKSISCARQLVRKSTVSSIKSLPKITENNLSVKKTSHKEENKIKTRLVKECKNVF